MESIIKLALMPREPVAAALDMATDALRKPFRELTGYALLIPSDDRYTLSHALIGTYARDHHPPPDPAVERLAAFFTAFAKEHAAAGLEGSALIDNERLHILNIITFCHDLGLWSSVTKLVHAIKGYLYIRGHWTEHIEALFAGVDAARELMDRRSEGALINGLGITHFELGQVEEGIKYFKKALIIAQDTGNRRDEGAFLGNLGVAYSALDQMENAIELCQEALTISREIGDRKGEGKWLGNLGSAYRKSGQTANAIEYSQQALAISREIGDRREEGVHLVLCGINTVTYFAAILCS